MADTVFKILLTRTPAPTNTPMIILQYGPGSVPLRYNPYAKPKPEKKRIQERISFEYAFFHGISPPPS
jgi:hypothetical protein